jgi:Tfp pilus assembly protein PilF
MKQTLAVLALLLWLVATAAWAQPPEATPAPTTPAPEKKPETAKDYFDLGVQCFQRGDLAGAERNSRTAIALKSHYAEAHYLLGRVLLFRAAERNRVLIENRGGEGSVLPRHTWKEGAAEIQEAIAQFRIVIKLDPGNTDGWLLLATCLDNLDQADEAESAYRQTINLDPATNNARDAHNNLGLLYLRQKKTKEAKSEFEAALAIDPAFGPARLNLDRLKKK